MTYVVTVRASYESASDAQQIHALLEEKETSSLLRSIERDGSQLTLVYDYGQRSRRGAVGAAGVFVSTFWLVDDDDRYWPWPYALSIVSVSKP